MQGLYHIALVSDWAAAQADGEYRTSTRGRTLEEEGFIHCSFAEQVEATASRYYHDLDELVVVQIDPGRVDAAVVVEGDFPHVYGPIPVDAVVAAHLWRRSTGPPPL